MFIEDKYATARSSCADTTYDQFKQPRGIENVFVRQKDSIKKFNTNNIQLLREAAGLLGGVDRDRASLEKVLLWTRKENKALKEHNYFLSRQIAYSNISNGNPIVSMPCTDTTKLGAADICWTKNNLREFLNTLSLTAKEDLIEELIPMLESLPTVEAEEPKLGSDVFNSNAFLSHCIDINADISNANAVKLTLDSLSTDTISSITESDVCTNLNDVSTVKHLNRIEQLMWRQQMLLDSPALRRPGRNSAINVEPEEEDVSLEQLIVLQQEIAAELKELRRHNLTLESRLEGFIAQQPADQQYKLEIEKLSACNEELQLENKELREMCLALSSELQVQCSLLENERTVINNMSILHQKHTASTVAAAVVKAEQAMCDLHAPLLDRLESRCSNYQVLLDLGVSSCDMVRLSENNAGKGNGNGCVRSESDCVGEGKDVQGRADNETILDKSVVISQSLSPSSTVVAAPSAREHELEREVVDLHCEISDLEAILREIYEMVTAADEQGEEWSRKSSCGPGIEVNNIGTGGLAKVQKGLGDICTAAETAVVSSAPAVRSPERDVVPYIEIENLFNNVPLSLSTLRPCNSKLHMVGALSSADRGRGLSRQSSVVSTTTNTTTKRSVSLLLSPTSSSVAKTRKHPMTKPTNKITIYSDAVDNPPPTISRTTTPSHCSSNVSAVAPISNVITTSSCNIATGGNTNISATKIKVSTQTNSAIKREAVSKIKNHLSTLSASHNHLLRRLHAERNRNQEQAKACVQRKAFKVRDQAKVKQIDSSPSISTGIYVEC